MEEHKEKRYEEVLCLPLHHLVLLHTKGRIRTFTLFYRKDNPHNSPYVLHIFYSIIISNFLPIVKPVVYKNLLSLLVDELEYLVYTF